MSVTMADVAKEAGVDKATVSRVLRGDPRISSKTREKVWEVIKRLEYKPNALARGLSERKSGLISVVVEEQQFFGLNRFLKGINRIMATVNKEPIIYVADDFEASFLRSRFVAHKVEGIIWVGSPPSDVDFPLIAIGETIDKHVSIVPYWEDLAQMIIKLADGRRIAFAGDTKPNRTLRVKLKGYKGKGKNSLWVCDGTLPKGIGRLINSNYEIDQDSGFKEEYFRKGDMLLLFNERDFAKAMGGYCIHFPCFEMGVLAAKLLVNILRHRDVPFKNLVRFSIE